MERKREIGCNSMDFLIRLISQNVLLFFAIAIIIANYVWLMVCRNGLHITPVCAFVIAVLHDIIGYAAMRLLAILEVGGDLSRAANMRLFGAVFILPLLYFAVSRLTKANFGYVMDVASLCLVIGLVFGRLDCLVTGCCQGALIAGSTSLYWPLREVELLYYIGFLVFFAEKIRKERTHGEVYPVFMITYGALRFVLEWFRVEYTTSIGPLHLAHIWALLSLAIGISIYSELISKKGKVRR